MDVDTAIDELDDDERANLTVSTPCGREEMRVVSEAGLYSIAFQSCTPEARAFQRWLVHEVLPQIRKVGEYELRKPLDALDEIEANVRANLMRIAELRRRGQPWSW